MNRIMRASGAAHGIFMRDFALFASYRMRFITTFFSTAVTLTLFYYISRLVRSPRIGEPDDYYAFAVVGIIVFGVLTSTLTMPVATLRQELVAGTFERMVLSPFGAVRSVMSLMLFPTMLAFVLATLGLGYTAAVFGLDVRWPEALAAIPLGVLAALAFAPFGLLLTAAVVVFKQTNAGATFVITGVTLVAGIYFPVSLLPDWIRWASDVQPFTPALDLLRHVLVDTPLTDEWCLDMLRLVGFPAVMMPLSLLVLKAAVTHSRRRGTIIEY